MNIEYLDTDESDRDFFRALNETCYRQIVENLFGAWDDLEENRRFDDKWNNQQFRKILHKGQLAGGVWVDEEETHHQLREIQLLPEFRGRGVGTAVLGKCIKAAQAQAKPLRLRVLKKNPAIRLYERLGFRVDGFLEASQHLLMVHGE